MTGLLTIQKKTGINAASYVVSSRFQHLLKSCDFTMRAKCITHTIIDEATGTTDMPHILCLCGNMIIWYRPVYQGKLNAKTTSR